MLLSKKKGWIKDMGIELKLCSKCGGKGRLYDFDHNYNPKNKSIKFLNKGNGLSTAAECLKCGRYTEHFWVPIDAINSWNKGEMYSGRNGKINVQENIMEKFAQMKKLEIIFFKQNGIVMEWKYILLMDAVREYL